MRASMIAMLLIGCGCGGSQASPAGEPAPSSAPGTVETETTPVTASPPATGATARDPGPPPALVVRGTPDRHRQVAIAIENRGTTTASVASAITLEAQRGDAWEALEGTALTTRADCQHQPVPCQELAPGAALQPPAWLGTIGDAQCACERCGAVPEGTYRFVARTCDGAHTLPGDPFELTR